MKFSRKSFLLILLFFISLSSFSEGENVKIDSLKILLEQTENQQEKEDICTQIIEVYLSLSSEFENKQDFDKALLYYKKYNNLYDSLFTIQKEKQLEELHFKYNTAKHNSTIELLKKDQEIKKEQNAIQDRRIRMLFVMVFVIVSIFVLILVLKRKSYIAEKVLVEKNIELAKEREKTRNKKTNKTHSEMEFNSLPSVLTEQQKLGIKDRITTSMEEDKLYLQTDLTINILSDYLKINRTYISKVINECFNKNFNTYINEYRIDEAMRLLVTNKNYTIEGVAQDVGFKSKSSFNLAFKKHSGITPSFFIKKSNSNK